MCECLAKSLGCRRASASSLSEELGRQGTAEGRHWEENWQKDHGDPQAGYLGKGSGFKLQGKELGTCSILKETEVLPELGALWREEGVGLGTAGGGVGDLWSKKTEESPAAGERRRFRWRVRVLCWGLDLWPGWGGGGGGGRGQEGSQA